MPESRIESCPVQRADVNAKYRNGATALILASNYSHLDVVQALLAHRADVNAKTNYGSTALTDAKDGKVRALLIQAGGKP